VKEAGRSLGEMIVCGSGMVITGFGGFSGLMISFLKAGFFSSRKLKKFSFGFPAPLALTFSVHVSTGVAQAQSVSIPMLPIPLISLK